MKLHPIESLGNIPAQTGDIRVERIEKRFHPKVPFPHRHGFYHFLFLEKGSGWHEIDFKTYKVCPGQGYFVKPGEVHGWQLSKSTRGFVLEFTRESLAQPGLLAKLESVPALIEGKAALALEPFFRLMLDEIEAGQQDFRLCLEGLLLAFVTRVVRTQKPKKGRISVPLLVSQFQQLVDQYFKQEHSVEFYAQRLGLSGKALTTKISKALGKSAGAIIQDRCLIEAKRLLAYADLSIAEIGYQIGYEDPNYFARFFRQKTGHTPGEFRKRATRSVRA